MKNAIEFKTSQMKALIKRKNILNKKYQTTVPDDIPLEVKSELELIDNLLNEFDINQNLFDEKPTMIGIKNSRDEEWYFQQMKHWVERHPKSLNAKFSRSSVYKFALHFFVENIALNANNARLNYSELAQKVSDVGAKKSNSKLTVQLENVENLLGFLLTMQQRQLEYIPEGVNLENGFVKYAINPINPTEFQQFGAPTELNPNNELAQSYEEYKRIRSRDKQLIKKYHQTGGQLDEFNWHHPTQVSEMADSQHERDNRTYYLAQISLILFNNYQQSYMQIAQMLNMSSRTARRLTIDYEQDFDSLEEIMEELQNGEDW